VRLDIRRTCSIKSGEEVIGSETRVKVVKNKVAPPFKGRRFRHSLRRRHLPAKGRFWNSACRTKSRRQVRRLGTPQREKIGQGKDNARIFLKERPETGAQRSENKIRAAVGVNPVVVRGCPGLSCQFFPQMHSSGGISLNSRAMRFLARREHFPKGRVGAEA